MPEAVPQMRFWGWGEQAHAGALPDHAVEFLRENLGVAEQLRPPVAIEQVTIEPTRLSDRLRAELAGICGKKNVREDHTERVLHAAGKGYPDLVCLRAGEPEGSPDVVVHPGGHEEIMAVLELASARSLAVVPFGGGTSVVGGLAPLRGEHEALVSLDLGRLGGLLALDRESMTVRVGAGIRGPALERLLGAQNLTLGHFPQSFEYVSIGGCAATRSAGQSSTGYGSIEKMILGLRLAAPAGEILLPAMPATAAGPGLRQLLVGSEGSLGVISEVALRVRHAPQTRIYEGVFFESFAAGTQALHELAGEHVLPDVARLSDEQETRMSLALAGSGGIKGTIGRAYLAGRGYRQGCLAILGFDGAPGEVAFRRRRALQLARRCGGLTVGTSPGRAWLEGRFGAPYLRDELLERGVMVETLETATQWSNLGDLHRAVSEAIAGSLGETCLVMCHVSHVYESGASLYFTFLAPQRQGAELEQWRQVKTAASQAIIDGGGTITHHHAVGRDHAPWMAREVGEEGLRVLRAAKAELDPAGIMNPGKLLDVSP